MGNTIKVRYTRDIGNTPRGTIREVSEHSGLLRRGVVVKVGTAAEKAIEPAEEEETEKPLTEMSAPELKKAAEKRGLDTRGRKAEVLARLQAHDGPLDPHHAEGHGGEPRDGETRHPEDTDSDDLTDLDGADAIVTEAHFDGAPNDGKQGIRIATTEDFVGDSDSDQEAIVAPGGEDEDF